MVHIIRLLLQFCVVSKLFSHSNQMQIISKQIYVGCPRDVMVKAMDCRIVVCEFELQSRYYVHFRARYPWEKYEPPYPPNDGLNSTTTVLLG